eukprot:4844447-Prymnesium_polylepis.1
MTYNSTELLEVGNWTRGEEPGTGWLAGTWRLNASLATTLANLPMQLMPPPLQPPPSAPPSPPNAHDDYAARTVFFAVVVGGAACMFAAAVLKRYFTRAYLKLRHILQLPRIWCSRWLARQQSQKVVEVLFWRLGGWTLADARTLGLLQFVQFVLAMLVVRWNGIVDELDITQLYFALFYTVIAVAQSSLTRSAIHHVRTIGLLAAAILYFLLGVVPFTSAFVMEDTGNLTLPPSNIGRSSEYICGAAALLLCAIWVVIARIAAREFGWRRRAQWSIHAAMLYEHVRRSHAVQASMSAYLHLSVACGVLEIVMVVCHIVRCEQMTVEVAVAWGVLTLQMVSFSVLHFSGPKLSTALAAAGVPGSMYMVFVTTHIRYDDSCDAQTANHDGEYMNAMMNVVQLATSVAAVVLQVGLFLVGRIWIRFEQAANELLARNAAQKVNVRSRKSLHVSARQKVTGPNSATKGATAARRRSSLLMSVGEEVVSLPPEYEEVPAYAKSLVQQPLKGHEMLIYLPLKRFPEKRFVQMDILLRTVRWSWKDYIGFDQIEDVYIHTKDLGHVVQDRKGGSLKERRTSQCESNRSTDVDPTTLRRTSLNSRKSWSSLLNAN